MKEQPDHIDPRNPYIKSNITTSPRITKANGWDGIIIPQFLGGVSAFKALSQCFAMQVHTYRMYMIIVLHP